jgi:hypothetical protein
LDIFSFTFPFIQETTLDRGISSDARLEEIPMHVIRLSALLVLTAALSIATRAQTGSYTCAQFQFFGPTNNQGNSVPYGTSVNSSDRVVGVYDYYQTQYGFTDMPGGTFKKFLYAGDTGTYFGGINDAGDVVGYSYYYTQNGIQVAHSFEGNTQGLSVNIVYPGAADTFATGINNQSQIVGYYLPQTPPTQGFILSDGQFTSLAVPGAETTQPLAINDSGTVVGTWQGFNPEAFIYSDGTYTTEAGPAGSGETFFTGINNQSQIAGYYLNTDVNPPVFQGFVYSGGTYYIAAIPNTKSVELGGINNNGDITGGVTLTNGNQPAFLGTQCTLSSASGGSASRMSEPGKSLPR